jgi:hypothetical protein
MDGQIRKWTSELHSALNLLQSTPNFVLKFSWGDLNGKGTSSFGGDIIGFDTPYP